MVLSFLPLLSGTSRALFASVSPTSANIDEGVVEGAGGIGALLTMELISDRTAGGAGGAKRELTRGRLGTGGSEYCRQASLSFLLFLPSVEGLRLEAVVAVVVCTRGDPASSICRPGAGSSIDSAPGDGLLLRKALVALGT